MARVEKRTVDEFGFDQDIFSRPGWEGLKVWWLVGKEETGTPGVVMNVADFPPNSSHEIHRHANAHEIWYLVRGSAVLLHDGEPIPITAGEVAVHPAGEWHGVVNDTDEVITAVSFWAGVDTYTDLEYEVLDGWRQYLPDHLK